MTVAPGGAESIVKLNALGAAVGPLAADGAVVATAAARVRRLTQTPATTPHTSRTPNPAIHGPAFDRGEEAGRGTWAPCDEDALGGGVIDGIWPTMVGGMRSSP